MRRHGPVTETEDLLTLAKELSQEIGDKKVTFMEASLIARGKSVSRQSGSRNVEFMEAAGFVSIQRRGRTRFVSMTNSFKEKYNGRASSES